MLALIGLLAGAIGAGSGSGFAPARTESWAIPEPDLFAVDTVGSHAWAVGYWGAVLRSTDAGRSWTAVETPTDASLYDVDFADERHGWAVGARGTLLATRDGGLSWERVPVTRVDPFDGSERPLTANLFGVSAVSPRVAWAVGDFGAVLRTRDGSSWSTISISEETFGDDEIPDRIFNAVDFLDASNGWIAGEFGTTLRTADGGETWLGERVIEGAINDIYLFDLDPDGAGWALAGGVGGVAIASSDGGGRWQALPVPTTAGLFGAAVSGPRGILVGDRGVLLLTSDAGLSWREPERPRSFKWLRGAVFGSDGLALVVGEDGVILRSEDAGASWERVPSSQGSSAGAESSREQPHPWIPTPTESRALEPAGR